MPRRRRSLGRGGHKRSRSATLSSRATPGPSGQLSQTTVEAFETENNASEQPIESLSDTEAVDTAKHLAEAEIEAGSYVLLPIKFHNSTAVVNFDFENMGGGHKLPPGAVEARYPLRPTKPKGKLIPKIYKDRIESFYKEGQYEKYNLRAMMFEGAAVGEKYVQLSSWAAPDLTRPKFKEATSHKFEPAKVGDWFGPSWATHWFKIEVTVPSELRDKERLEFHWDADTEGMVWSQGGDPLQGLTGGGERVEWILPDSFRDGKSHTFYIEMACNGMFGTGEGIQPPDPNKQFKLKTADIVAVNLQARGLFIDSWIIGDAAREFPENSRQQHQALVVINRIVDTFELGNKDSIIECRKIAQEYIGKHVDSAKVYQSGTTPEVFGVGHCHIDTCWLWPWAETRRKTARSWTNQCNLMDQYPELNFVVSQAQQYKWLKEDYPYVYERLSKKVKEGQFHPIGGSWVEHDTNMPSGESLVRQFLYGQRFFEGHFGKRCETFWLPDTFGYSSQLPQLCRLAGMGRFLTQKLSWNNINNFPHTSFNWVALDGTQVLCHMPPSETYTADAHFGDVKRSIENHKSMDADHTSLLVFGKGDGGGGPTWEHLEKLRRCRGMADTVGLLPTVHMGNTVDDFFAQLETKADKLPTWNGELYFELHRGTYTTQANNKLNNRKGEFILRDIEMLATFASLKDSSFKYPKKEIDFMWEAVLLCQFHDCLPGSSIEMCYDDSDELYAEVFKTAKRVLNDIYKALGVSDQPAIAGATEVALNTLPWHRREVVDTADGKGAIASGAGNLLTLEPIQAAGEPAVSINEVNKGVFVMQNDQLRVQIEDGVITSLFDRKADREVLAKGGKANQYVIFDDKPLYWQAWDVEVFHLESRKELASGPSEISEDKGHRVSVVTKTKISELSSLVTTISLSAAIEGELSSVEVTCDVDWHESMKFLKVEFPVDITNDEASYETQYGLVRRPTHYNTTWDMAKFEVCCHKFADLSEHGYGVSVLNDSKYGFATSGNVMRLSLLRSPKAPDAHADMGAHHIRWAILPHAGRLGAATVRKGYEFNNKLKVLSAPDPQAVAATGLVGRCPVRLAGDASLVLDCVKRGEDDEDVGRDEGIPRRKGRSVVLRLYDSLGGRSRGVVETSYDVRKVFKTNVLEDDLEEVPVDEHGRFAIELHAFEVATYRLQL